MATWAIGGAIAGVAGALLLARLPRGVVVPVWTCGLGVAAAWGAASAAAPQPWWFPVPLVLGWLAVLLSATDIAAQRLPDALTLPAYPVLAVLLVLAAAGTAEVALLVRGGLGVLAWAGCYVLVRVAAPAALGGGDVKLAGTLGAVTAAASWSGLLVAMLGAALLTLALAVPARALGRRHVPHGPAMLAAAWLVVL